MYSFHQSYIYVYLMFGFQCLTDYFFEYLVMNKTTGNFPKYYIFNNMWGCVRATRSLHDEVPGMWFTSWPLFFLIFLQLLLTLLLLYFSYIYPSSSSIVAVLIAKAGHVWVSWPEEFLLYFLSLTLQQVCYCQEID